MKTNRNLSPLLCLFAAVTALFTCEKVPDYCGKGEWYDPGVQFCFAGKAYNQCGGGGYNPLTEGCINGTEVGTRCVDGSVVKLGTPCDGYILTTAATPENGGSVTRTPPDRTNFTAGENVVLSASPNDEFAFIGWAGADTSKAATLTVNMNANKPLVAMFRPVAPGTLIATAFSEIGGAVSRNPNKDSYDLYETVTVTAKAAAGYTFSGWSGASTSKNATETITMDESKTLVAMFTPVAHTLTVNVNPTDAGAVFVNGTALSGAATQDFGTEIEVWALAEKGYVFKEWTGTAEFEDANNPNTKVTLGADATITANFRRGEGGIYAPPDTGKKQLYPVTVVLGGTGASIGGEYAEGEKVTISAGTPPEGQRFKNWTTTSNGVTFANANSATTTFVMPGRAVTVTAGFEVAGGAFKTVVIGWQTWMAENLNVVTGNSWCYDDDEANCNVYGRLYDWETAMTACPVGYHLPSSAEWRTLIDYAASKLKSQSGWNYGDDGSSLNGTDEYGFSALPGGWRNIDGSFENVGYYGHWWTATVAGVPTEPDNHYAISRLIYSNHSWLISGINYGYSVRCILDETITPPPPNYGTLTDERDGQTYKTVELGNQKWMAENLNYLTDSSWCYDDDMANCSIYGRLYTWDAAMTVCPRGYHLPSILEWRTLLIFASGSSIAGSKLKSQSGWDDHSNFSSSDEFGFSALPGGERYVHGAFSGVGSAGSWWTSEEKSDGVACFSQRMDYFRDEVAVIGSINSEGLSVRCVAD